MLSIQQRHCTLAMPTFAQVTVITFYTLPLINSYKTTYVKLLKIFHLFPLPPLRNLDIKFMKCSLI